MHYILTLPPVALFFALLLFVSVSMAMAMLMLLVLRRIFKVPTAAVPVATFLSVAATAWALALGFAAADVWSLRNAADQAASAERSSILRLEGIAEQGALDSDDLHDAIIQYAHVVRAVEWGENLNALPDPEVDDLLQAMRLTIVDLARADIPDPLLNKLVRDFDELQDARNARLSIGQSVVDDAKWYLVVLLTVMNMVAISACHLDRPVAGFNALVIYGVVVLASLWVLGIHINPYTQLTIPFEVVHTT